MTTISEALTAKGYTPAAQVPAVFGRARTIDGIVIHHWGALGQRHQDVVDFFVNGPGTTSAHFVVSAGRIDCLVSPLDAAWHSGSALGNATTIGIECHPEATDADYATVAELVNFLRGTYGTLPLSPHRQWNQTACPGVWDLPRIDRIAAGSAAIAPQSTTITQEDPMPTLDEIFNYPIQRAGGQTGVTSLRAFVAYWDANNANTRKMVQDINPYVHSLVSAAVTQILGKTVTVDPATVQAAVASAVASVPAPGVDPAAIAKAVNDDAAARRQNWK